jgi:glycosyltransferase involved in cell wall biosynthesis
MPSAGPTITVLIPTFNRAQYLAECLDSILSQTLAPTQIIVVNDGSTDDTQLVLEPYMNAVAYLSTDQLGKPGAINRGLEAVSGDYLWIFDDDDVVLANALERLVAPLEQCPEHGFSYCKFFWTGTDAKSGQIGAVFDELRLPDVDTRGYLIPLLEANFLGGAALFARTSCYAQVGGFDPGLLRSQDYEMAIRIARSFTGIRVPGGATFHYRQHEGMRGSSKDRFAAGSRLGKWLEYDQIFFRKLYEELALDELLPPGVCAKTCQRQAILQRLAIMASKLLVPQAINDLRQLAVLSDRAPFSEQERVVVRLLIAAASYYKTGSILDSREFCDELYRLSTSSAAIRLLRGEIRRALMLRLGRFSRGQTLTAMRALYHMYLAHDRRVVAVD